MFTGERVVLPPWEKVNDFGSQTFRLYISHLNVGSVVKRRQKQWDALEYSGWILDENETRGNTDSERAALWKCLQNQASRKMVCFLVLPTITGNYPLLQTWSKVLCPKVIFTLEEEEFTLVEWDASTSDQICSRHVTDVAHWAMCHSYKVIKIQHIAGRNPRFQWGLKTHEHGRKLIRNNHRRRWAQGKST